MPPPIAPTRGLPPRDKAAGGSSPKPNLTKHNHHHPVTVPSVHTLATAPQAHVLRVSGEAVKRDGRMGEQEAMRGLIDALRYAVRGALRHNSLHCLVSMGQTRPHGQHGSVAGGVWR